MDRTTLRELRRKGKRFSELESMFRDLERRYLALEIAFPDPFIFCDFAGKVEHVNSRFEETFGWQADEVRGMVAPYVSRSERDGHVERLKAVAEGRELPFRFRGQSKDGALCDITAYVSICEGKSGYPDGFVAVLKLVAPAEGNGEAPIAQPASIAKTGKNKQHSSASGFASGSQEPGKRSTLRGNDTSGDLFKRHFCGSRVGMIVVDLVTGEAHLNQALADMTAPRPEKSADADSEEVLCHMRESPGTKELWELIAKGRSNSGADIELVRAEGERTFVRASVSVLRKRPGRKPVMAATVVDVTKLKGKADRAKAFSAAMPAGLAALEKKLEAVTRALYGTEQDLAKARKDASEVNEAAKLLISKITEQRKELQQSIAHNLGLTVHPLLDHLKTTALSQAQFHLVDTLDFNLKQIAARFGVDFADRRFRLSPREIQICRMIRNGKDSREIAEAFGLARQTIVVHRKNIRKKLGLKSNKQNLATYLKEHM